MFIDETWAKTNMTRRHGRSPRGTRLIAKVPHGRWRTLTFLAALRCDRIAAPCVIDGPINGTSFRAYVERNFEQFNGKTPRRPSRLPNYPSVGVTAILGGL